MFEKLDKIIITEKDYKKISEWNQQRIENEKNDNDDSMVGFPLTEGVVIVEQYIDNIRGITAKETIKQGVYFKVDEGDDCFTIDIVVYDMKDYSKVIEYEVIAREKGIDFNLIENYVPIAKKKDVDTSMKQALVLLIDTFRYMVNVPQEVIEKDEIRSVSKRSKSKGNRKSSNKIVKVTTKKYIFTHSNKDYVKNNYERHKESWSVRGHWRFYKKTGKKVWVKPHVKGNIEEVEGKTYKF